MLDLLSEAWVTGNLEHPNVVPVYDVGVDAKGGPLVALKCIEGAVWADLLHEPARIEERFGAKDALAWNLSILMQVMNAVAFAHSRGIVHRDIKPENVMVGQFGEVYLLDWGIAVSTDPQDVRIPRAADATQMAGTPCYMAPEMLGGQASSIGPSSDIYLLGAVLYEILVGEPPHDGPNVQALVASILTSEPRWPGHVPGEAVRLASRAMAREPHERFATVEAMRRALEDFVQHRGSRRLAERADERRAALVDAIAADAPVDELYDLLGECRFGYRAALAPWEQNEDAVSGLRAALVAMIEHELAHGEPHAAARLLREVVLPDESLVLRVRQAEAARAADADRLARLDRDFDPGTGAKTRIFVSTMLGILWVGLPLYGHLHAPPPTHGDAIVASAVLVACFVGFVRWARDSFTRTLVNQRLAGSLFAVLLSHLVMELAADFAGLPVTATWPFYPLTWATMLAAVSLWFEPRFWPSTAAAAALTAFSIAVPAKALLGFALFNAGFVVNVVWAWLPLTNVRAGADLVRVLREARKRRRVGVQTPRA
jgi:hypothetical protein